MYTHAHSTFFAMQPSHSVQPGRREVFRLLGVTAAAALAPIAGAHAGVRQADARAAAVPRGAILRTVLRDVAPQSLSGPILTHEHLSMTSAFMDKFRSAGGNPPAAPSPPLLTENLDAMIEELRATRAEGVAAIVDGGSLGIGRDIEFLKQLSARTNMPIIAGGGFFLEPFYPARVAELSEDELVEEQVRTATTERWGALGEIGSEAAFTPLQRKVFRATARVHLRTGLPIFTHTAGGRMALEQLDLFEAMGVKPPHLMIGHLSRLNEPNIDVHKAIAARGVFVGFDQVGRGAADAGQVQMVRALVDAGYVDQILLSADFGSAASEFHRSGGSGFGRTVTVFVPMLRKAGVSDAAIRRITVDNPRRFLAFVPAATA